MLSKQYNQFEFKKLLCLQTLMLSGTEITGAPNDITNMMTSNQDVDLKQHLDKISNIQLGEPRQIIGNDPKINPNLSKVISNAKLSAHKSAKKTSIKKIDDISDDENSENVPLNPSSKKIVKKSTAKKSITKETSTTGKKSLHYGSLVDRLFQSQARENIRSKLELGLDQTNSKKVNEIEDQEEPPVERDLVKAIELAASLKKDDSKTIITEEQEKLGMSPLSELDKIKLVTTNSVLSDIPGISFPELSVDRRISLDSLLLQSSEIKDPIEENKEPIIQLTPLPIDESLLVEATPAEFRNFPTSIKKKVEFKDVILDKKEFESPSTNAVDPRFKTPSNRKTFRIVESSSSKKNQVPVNDTPFNPNQPGLNIDPNLAASLSILKNILPVNIENGQLQLTVPPGFDVGAVLSALQNLSQKSIEIPQQNVLPIPEPELVAVPIQPDNKWLQRKNDRRSSSSKKLCPSAFGVKRTSNYKNRKNRKNLGPCDPNSKIEPEKLLEMSLGELSQNSYQPNDGFFKFLQRGSSINEAETKNMKEVKPIEPEISSYSQKLGIGSSNGNDTPISKTFKQSLLNAGELKSTIQDTIDAFQKSLQKAKKRFFELQSFKKNPLQNGIKETIPELEEDKNDTMNLESQETIPNTTKTEFPIEQVAEKIQLEETLPNSGSIITEENEGTPLPLTENQVPQVQPESSELLSLKNKILTSESLWDFIRNRPREEITLEKIKEVAKREFGIRDLDPFQLECIRTILNRKSCIFRSSVQKSKFLTFQIAALMAQGLVIYIHSSLTYMINQIQHLVPSLSGACINNLLSREETNKILNLVRSNQVKILYITPERFLSENLGDLPELSFVCIDEAHCIPTISSNFRMSHLNVYKHLKANLECTPVISIVPPIAYETVIALAEMFSVEENCIYPKDYFNSCQFDITISRDDDKMRALINFLSRLRTNNALHSMIIYTESRKSVEDVAGILPRNGGFKTYPLHNGKTESQKFEMINNFSKNPGGIIVTTSGTELGIDRNLIKGVIHYCLPKSLEVYIQEISHLNEKAFCHMFLHDEDYYRARQSQNAELIEACQVIKFAEKVYDSKNQNKENSSTFKFTTGKKVKKDSNLNPSSQENSMLSLLLKTKDEPSQQIETEEDKNLVFSTKVNELCREIDLKKELAIELFETFEHTCDWMKFLGVSPISCTIKFLCTPETVSTKYPIIKNILEKGKKSSGIYKIVIVELANELKCEVNDITKILKQ